MTAEDREDLPDTIENKERGCGFLKPNATYLRVDPEMVSSDGEIPIFTEFDEPVKYKEDHFRGWKSFPRIQFELKYTGNGGHHTVPNKDEVAHHIGRLSDDVPSGYHAGQELATHAHDLLMWVGESHYKDPEEFIEEAKKMGANKRIPKTNPPVIDPLRTRVFLIHPRAIEDEDGNRFAGIIGYFYPTRVVHTLDEDGEVPEKVKKYADQGVLDIVDRGPEIGEEEQEMETLEKYGGSEET